MPQTISRETFDKGDIESKLGMIFDTTKALGDKFDKQVEHCDHRICKLENNKRKNTLVSGAGGVIGGFVAMIGKWLIEGK